MKIAVVTFLGSNCDADALYAATSCGALGVPVWHGDATLPDGTEAVLLPGGFSYGDALRAGAIARFAAIMPAVVAFAENGGLVLGICNGFQILLESGLLPGAMLPNASDKFICRQVTLDVANRKTPFTRAIESAALRMPVAHHQGRYFAPPTALDALDAGSQVVLTYRDNPNGSVRDIAGICNPAGNVLGMMPHPERAIRDVLGGTDGRGIFASMLAHVEARG